MHYARLMLVLAALSACPGTLLAQRQDLVANKYLPPEVGAIAPPIGNVRWLQVADEDKGQAPEIARLCGRVVVVQTYGHYCDP